MNPPNPWHDPGIAGRWKTGSKPGNPFRDEQVEVVVELAVAGAPGRILDLGCGTCEISGLILERRPDAECVGLDVNRGMLDRARDELGPLAERFRFVEAALEDDWRSEVGEGFDFVLASQTVHHLGFEEKAVLIQRTHDVVAPGGLFLLSDRVELPDDRLFPWYHALWNRARRRHGFDELSGYDLKAHRRQLEVDGDLPDLMEDHLAWMLEAGFGVVDCFWRHGNRAIFGGLKVKERG